MSKKASEELRNLIKGSSSSGLYTPSPSIHNCNKRKKISNKGPKRFNYDVTIYDYPGSVFNKHVELEEKSLKQLGSGGIVIMEDEGENKVRNEIAELVKLFVDAEKQDITSSMFFLKRIGRKKAFKRHQHSSSFAYDALGIRDMVGKDCKSLYVMMGKPFGKEPCNNNQSRSFLYSSSTPNYFDNNSSDSLSCDDYILEDVSKKALEFGNTTSVTTKCDDIFKLLQSKDLNNKKVCDETTKYQSLLIAVLILSHLKDFSGTMAIVLKEKKGSASDIEHAMGQVLLLLNSTDKYLWDFALKDLSAELKLHSSVGVIEILSTIFESLRSLDCEMWNELFFRQLFRSVLLNEYYTADGFNECEEEQDEIWRRQFFQRCPSVLLLGLQWKFNKQKFLESSEKIPANLLEDARSTNLNQYFIGLLVIKTNITTYLLVNCKELEKWKIYVNGNMYCLDMNEDILDMFYSLPDAQIDLVMYTNRETVIEKMEVENIKIHGQFLMKRLQERKSLLRSEVDIDDLSDPNEGEYSKDQLIKERLKGIFGQKELKQKIEVLARRAVFNTKRGVSTKNDVSNLHMFFSGNPGTGKTMAARCMAGVFKDLGITKTEKVIEVQRSDLVADHIGGTAKLTEKYLKQAEGGLFFLDEAYHLCSSSDRDYGKEALETIMQRMNANPNRSIQNPIFIFAGYKEEMSQFLQLNPGLPRRIKINLPFKNFKPHEMTEIAKKKMLEDRRRFPHEMDCLLTTCFEQVPINVQESNNAALCKDLIDAIQTQHESRLCFDCSVADLEKFSIDDITSGIEAFLNSPMLRSGDLVKRKEVGTSTSDLVMYADTETMTGGGEDPVVAPHPVIVPEVTLNIPGQSPMISTPLPS